jgi:tetratricopeptide (TPR) repeat protein
LSILKTFFWFMSKTIQKQSGSVGDKNTWFYISDLKARLLLVLACFVCYGNTIFNNYSLDDDFAITDNAFIQKGLSGIPDILSHPYAATEDKVMDFRPIPGITFAIEQQFFGTNPHVSHFLNIVFFSCCVLILFTLIKKVFKVQQLHPVLPLLICMFYVVHPSHTEVVASLKSRDEILSSIFVLLAFLCAFNFWTAANKRTQAAYAAGSFLFLGLSFISKLTAMPMVAIMILTGIFYGFHKEKLKFYTFNFFLLAFAITYISVIVYYLKRPTYDLENPLFYNKDFSIRLGTAFATMFFYFKFMLVPFPFRFYYGYNMIPLIPMGDSTAMVSFLLHLFLFSYGAWLFFRKEVLGLFILCYLLGLVLYSNYFGNFPGIVGERVLFSPSIWFISALVLFLFRVAQFDKIKGSTGFLQKPLLIIGALVFMAYTWLTIQRNFQWKDKLTLMAADMPYLSNSSLANFFYASSLFYEAQKSNSASQRNYYLSQAQKHYRQTIHVSPAYPEAYFKMGMLFEYELQQYDSAFEYFKKAYPLDTTKTPVEFQLAKSYHLKGNNAEADKLFKDLYRKLPTDTFTLFFYSRVRYFLGDTATALLINEHLKKLAPASYYAYWNNALYLHQAGRFPEAIPFYETALKYGYRDRDIMKQMADYYASTGQTDKVSIMQRYLQ